MELANLFSSIARTALGLHGPTKRRVAKTKSRFVVEQTGVLGMSPPNSGSFGLRRAISLPGVPFLAATGIDYFTAIIRFGSVQANNSSSEAILATPKASIQSTKMEMLLCSNWLFLVAKISLCNGQAGLRVTKSVTPFAKARESCELDKSTTTANRFVCHARKRTFTTASSRAV
jgi:hypothetical protein